MTKQEATAWINGHRSTVNLIPSDSSGSWHVLVAQADAAMTQQAYWILKALHENLVEGATK